VPSKAVWGRLTNALSGRVYKLSKSVVSVGRREANEADILVLQPSPIMRSLSVITGVFELLGLV